MKTLFTLTLSILSAAVSANSCETTDRLPNQLCFKKLNEEFIKAPEISMPPSQLHKVKTFYGAKCFYEAGKFSFGDKDRKMWIGIVGQEQVESRAKIIFPDHGPLPADGIKIVLFHATGLKDTLLMGATKNYYMQEPITQVSVGSYTSVEHLSYYMNGSVKEAADVKIKFTEDAIFYRLSYIDRDGELLCKAKVKK